MYDAIHPQATHSPKDISIMKEISSVQSPPKVSSQLIEFLCC